MLVKKLSNLIRARFPYIYITTYEEERVTNLIKKIVREPKLVKVPREVYIWTETNGFVNEETEKPVPGTITPSKALEFVEKCDKDAVFLFYDMHVNFGIKNRSCDYELVRRLRDLVSVLKTSQARKNVFFISPDLVIPEIEAISTSTLMELEEKEGLHVVPCAHAAHITMNREAIRTLAAEKLGLPTSNYFFASSLAEIKANGFAYVNKEVRNHLYDRGYMVATECNVNGLYRVQPGI